MQHIVKDHLLKGQWRPCPDALILDYWFNFKKALKSFINLWERDF